MWDRAIVQTWVIHLIRNTFRYASRKYWDEMARDLRPVYTAPSEAAAKERFIQFTGKWGDRYPAIIGLWEHAWSEFVPFLDYDVEIRRVICSTNAIESVNARYRPGPRQSPQWRILRSLRGRIGSRAWWRSAAAMLVAPAWRRVLIARLRRVAMTWGALPVRTWEWSSA